MTKQKMIISAEKLSVGYGSTVITENISFSLEKGKILALIGPNGAGKSTILKSIVRQLEAISGTVYIKERNFRHIDRAELAKSVSVMLTGRTHSEYMTCRDVASAGRYPYTGRLGVLSDKDRDKVDEALRLVNAEKLAERDITTLSDGQRQRVLIARALCQEPDILVLDEPTSFLDIRHKLELLTLLKKLAREQELTVILSLHEIDLAQKIADTVMCINGRYIDRIGTPEEVFTDEHIASLYGLTEGGYNSLFGSIELGGIKGTPEVFVIGGGGTGIPVYRRLQRENIPFAAGIIFENDLDYPVAKALSSALYSAPAFESVPEETFERALACMNSCKKVICTSDHFGTYNEANRRLAEIAAENKKLQ